MDHEILLRRLRSRFRVHGSAYDWISSFLYERSQQVFYKGRLSAKLQLFTAELITGSALALHCCKAHARKIENSTSCKIVTHEDINLKFGTRDYVADITTVQL